MSLSRFDDGALWHPKAVEAGEDAANLWIRSIMYANRYNTDGLIRTGAVAGFTTKPPKVVAALIEALVTARLWDVEPGVGWRIHDFLDWNDSREEKDRRAEEISAKRSAAGKAGNAKRWGAKVDRKTIANGSQTDRNVRVATVATDRSVPYRTVPESESRPVASACDAQATEVDPTPGITDSDAAELATLRAEKAARDEATAEAARVEAEKDEARRAKNREKAKAREENPPPFSVGEAFELIASTAGGRFVPGVERDWTGGIRIAVAKMIRTYPTREEWQRLGRWLAAGGDAFRKVLGPSWAASTACVDAMARSREWSAAGEGPVGDPMQSGVFTLSAPQRDRNGRPIQPPVMARDYLARRGVTVPGVNPAPAPSPAPEVSRAR
jgi:hypothetical protein